MEKLNHKLILIIFSAAAILSFAGAIFEDVQAQLNNAGRGEFSYSFVRDLTVGGKGDDVKALQQFLNSHGAQVSTSGPGSPGNETAYFGKATKAVLAQWQSANGISPAAGYFGPKTRSYMATMAKGSASSSSTPPPPIPAPAPLAQSLNNPSLSTVSQNPQQASSGFPVRLKIPKINVDAPVILVGITPDGAMDVPKGPAEVAWFKLGPRPGDNGSAVISGHFGRWKTGEGSVFDDLKKLSKGDKLYTEDERGEIVTFVVRESRNYNPNADASGVFGSSDGKAHLNLVTCEGTWIPDKKTYSDRLVVFADKEE